MLIHSLGEFEAVPVGAPRSPEIRKAPRVPHTPEEDSAERQGPGSHPFPEREEFCSSWAGGAGREGEFQGLGSKGPGVGPRASIS